MTGWYTACFALSLFFLLAQTAHPFNFLLPSQDTALGQWWLMGRGSALRSRQVLSTSQHSSLPASMEPGRGKARLHVQHVYIHSFGSHRCGSIIRYGKGCQQAERNGAGSLLSRQSLTDRSRGQRAAQVLREEADLEMMAAADGVQATGSCSGVKHVSLRCGGPRKEKADAFDFPFPSRNVEKVIKRKKKESKVWLKVWKVISKMLEENEKFRYRLLSSSQFSGEGNNANQSSQKGSPWTGSPSLVGCSKKIKEDSGQKEI
ncbi:uncharacterized protein C5orf47 homolog isoform X2 [Meleagris gallopavo]|uniref:uncharacterized protein C5orf47 homolog isoform X2 n=1 Tax=Meleagris gallopavo TaxID=9103 RepID=UPI0012AC01D2|nr:uncharacterized protein C5orf47 homolog isoform X2 [Meleagris gallopavo]